MFTFLLFTLTGFVYIFCLLLLSLFTFVLFTFSRFTDNGRGIFQYSKDLRDSNNLYHWVLRENIFERNFGGGMDIMLPYVWQYNENYTHTVHIGKKHALKKYDQFALNTSCFWGKYRIKNYPSCAISQIFCYKNNEY